MTAGWWQLTPTTRQLAENLLTRKQLDVLKLHLNGCSTYRISIMLEIAEPTARQHLNRAHQIVGMHLEGRTCTKPTCPVCNALRKDAA